MMKKIRKKLELRKIYCAAFIFGGNGGGATIKKSKIKTRGQEVPE